MVRKSVPSPVADMLSLEICSAKAMNKASILHVHVSALDSTFTSNN